MPVRFIVVGDGGMGTACALLLNKNPEHEVVLWSRTAQASRELLARRENVRYLPGVAIPDRVQCTSDFSSARSVDAVVLAIPMLHLASALPALAHEWPKDLPVVSVVKGIEQGSFRTPSEVVSEVVGAKRTVALTGPSHAEELARDLPASVVAASKEPGLAETVQEWFGGDRFRVYTTNDLRGAELAGALKNVVAIAAGACDGLELGDNAKSALVTRGLAEMVRVGVALGGREETFYGLAGVGDLLTTCMSRHSRNRAVGEQLGRGKSLQQILAVSTKVAEGVWTARSVHELSLRRGLSTPVVDAVFRVLFEGLAPLDAVRELMSREMKPER